MGAELVAFGYLAKKALDRLEDSFTDNVINRWTGYRARRFLKAFAETVAREAQDKGGEEKVNSLLNEMLSSERKTDALFEAYRRVVLSASKEIGPRIIALLTAELISHNRYATDGEEMIFRAAETFTDRELHAFRAALPDPTRIHDNVTENGGLKYTLDRKTLKVWTRAPASLHNSIPIGAMNLFEALGSWAPKAMQIGLLRHDVVESVPTRRPHWEDDESRREIEWSVIYAPASRRLVELIGRAEASMAASKSEAE